MKGNGCAGEGHSLATDQEREETVVQDDVVDAAVQAIIQAARTGQIGDGRVFVTPVSHSYKIRTGERDA